MFKIDNKENTIIPLEIRTFKEEGLTEVNHIQEWIAKNPDSLGEDLLIIQKEFAGFDDTQERLDLLALDKNGNLVIIENKRDDSGKDVTWQALKYVSYCSTLTKYQIADIYQEYLFKENVKLDSRQNILNFLEFDDFDELLLNSENTQRIILVAANFRKEATSTALWLLNNNIQIQCFKTTLFAKENDLFLNIEQIIPTPEAKDFMIGMRAKKLEEKKTVAESSHSDTIRMEFWEYALEKIKNSECRVFDKINSTKLREVWASRSGISFCRYMLVFNKNSARIGLLIDSYEKEENKFVFDQLKAHQTEIESSFANQLEWLRLSEGKISRILFEEKFDCHQKENWEEITNWMVEHMIKFENALKEPLKKINNQL